jgi:hypothetical protein
MRDIRRATSIAGLVIASLVTASTIGGPAAGARTVLPYSDSSAHGYIGLCDRSGHQITHGRLDAAPFAWRAVSSVAAQSPYDAPDRTATLYGYQPRQGLPAGDWSGQALTASARYTNPAHPMAAATAGDDSLADFIAAYQPQWDRLIQLRMYLGAPDHPVYSLEYPALDIRVSGTTWRAVDGGAVDCRSGHSTSIESILLTHKQITGHPNHRSAASARHRRHGGSASPGTSNGGSAPAAAAPAAATAGAGPAVPAVATSHTSSARAAGLTILIALAIALLIGTAVGFRRRGPTAFNSPSHGTSEKGR